MIQKAFEVDWNSGKISNFVKNEDVCYSEYNLCIYVIAMINFFSPPPKKNFQELQKVKQALEVHYNSIRNIFKYYATLSS